MDISKLSTVAEDDGVVVHLKDATDEPMFDGTGEDAKPVTLRVAGVYSSFYRAIARKETERGILRARRTGNKSVDVEELEESRIREQAACIREWSFQSGGKPFPITADNWKALLAMQPQWQQQVHEAMHDHAAFFARS